MTIYEVANGIADEMTKVRIVRREGYALCTVANTDIATLKKDYKWCVVLWGRKVLETIIEKGGYGLCLVIE